ncbi:MAG: CoA synthetase, partial [Pseudomonadota bacterium]
SPGTSPPEVHRPGGPHALVTELCVMRFDKARARFALQSLHPGVTLEEVRDRTGFDFDVADATPVTPGPDAETLALIRGPVARKIADPYPGFAARFFGLGDAA